LGDSNLNTDCTKKLVEATTNGDFVEVKKYIDCANLEFINDFHNNLLTIALDNYGYPENSDNPQYFDIIKLLLQKKVPIQHDDEIGIWSMHSALLTDKVEVMQLLLDNCADINAILDDCGERNTIYDLAYSYYFIDILDAKAPSGFTYNDNEDEYLKFLEQNAWRNKIQPPEMLKFLRHNGSKMLVEIEKPIHITIDWDWGSTALWTKNNNGRWGNLSDYDSYGLKLSKELKDRMQYWCDWQNSRNPPDEVGGYELESCYHYGYALAIDLRRELGNRYVVYYDANILINLDWE
jgi:hypothetical protein